MVRELLRQAPLAQVALVAVVIIGLMGTGATIAQMALLSQIVDRVFLGHRGLGQLHPALALLLGVIVARASVLWVREAVAQEAALRVKSALRARLFAHMLRLGPAYVRGERTGELAATALEGIERLDAYVGRYLPQIALSAGACAGRLAHPVVFTLLAHRRDGDRPRSAGPE
jgi:ATP-binding cassette subfamily C protein CydD